LPEYKPDPMRVLRERVSDILVGCGMQEIITYSLTSLEALRKAVPSLALTPLKIANRITSEQEYLRTTLRPGLLQALSTNEKHDEDSIRLFEVGKVYLPTGEDLPEELFMLAGVLSGPRVDHSWHDEGEALDFFDAKGTVEALFERLGASATFEPIKEEAFSAGRTASIVVGSDEVGIIGELHPRVAERFDISSRPIYLFEIDLERLLNITMAPRKYQPIPKFPATIRDIALVLDKEVPSKRVQDILESYPLVAQVTLFDVYTGDQVPHGKKSLAFRIVYQSPSRTLTDDEVNKEQNRILDRLLHDLGATLRD